MTSPNDLLPACLPTCRHEGHGAMTLRTNSTRLDAWCGTWYDCERCTSSTLFPSPELTAQNKAMVAA